MNFLREILFGVLLGTTSGFLILFGGILIPELWELVELGGISFRKIFGEFQSAWKMTLESSVLLIVTISLVTFGWLLWRGFKHLERRLILKRKMQK